MERLSRPDDWTLAEGQRDGFPMFLRIANAYLGMGGVPGYDYRLIVTAKFREPTQFGLPSREEGDELEAFELTLCDLLEGENESLGVLVITNQGIRDFIFYTRDPERAKQKLLMSAPQLASHKFEINIEHEPDWRVYRHFSKNIPTDVSPESLT